VSNEVVRAVDRLEDLASVRRLMDVLRAEPEVDPEFRTS
jgi:hypothetical protein